MRKQFKSFSKRLTHRIVLVVWLIMTIISLMVSLLAISGMTALSNEHYADIVEITNDKVYIMLSSVEVSAANNVDEIEQCLSSPAEVYTALKNELKLNPHIKGFAAAFIPDYYPKLGRWFEPYVVRRDSTVEMVQIGSAEHDYHKSPWYKKALTEEGGYWSDPYFDEVGAREMLCTYSLPIHDRHGKTVGVFAADFSLEWLSEQINETDKKENEHGLFSGRNDDKSYLTYSFIIGRNGEYIAHPDKDRILKESSSSSNDSTSNKSFKKIRQKMLAGETGYQFTKVDGIRSCIFYAPLKRAGWSMGIVVPVKTLLFSGLVIGFLILLHILIGLILIFVICYYYIRKATKPLKHLAASAGEVAQGRFDTPLPSIKNNDEIHMLRDSFEDMQHSLAKYIKQLTTTTAQNASMERELNIARNIQMSMLPKPFPANPKRKDIDVYGMLNPAKAVGGDLYDFFIRDEHLFFCIGDVSGKGVPASLVMAVNSAQFRTLSANESRPSRIISTINESQASRNESMMFVTLFVGILDLTTGELSYCNAGHDAPILVRKGDDGKAVVSFLTVDPNIPVGVDSDWTFTSQYIKLEPDTTIFLYTDGLTEAEGKKHAQFGEQRMIDALEEATVGKPMAIVNNMIEAVSQFVGDAEQSDDLTMLAIRYTGSV